MIVWTAPATKKTTQNPNGAARSISLSANGSGAWCHGQEPGTHADPSCQDETRPKKPRTPTLHHMSPFDKRSEESPATPAQRNERLVSFQDAGIQKQAKIAGADGKGQPAQPQGVSAIGDHGRRNPDSPFTAIERVVQ